jgi:hypothetical protein
MSAFPLEADTPLCPEAVGLVPGPDIRQTPDASWAAQSDHLQSVAVLHHTYAPTASAYVSLDVLHDGQS